MLSCHCTLTELEVGAARRFRGNPQITPQPKESCLAADMSYGVHGRDARESRGAQFIKSNGLDGRGDVEMRILPPMSSYANLQNSASGASGRNDAMSKLNSDLAASRTKDVGQERIALTRPTTPAKDSSDPGKGSIVNTTDNALQSAASRPGSAPREFDAKNDQQMVQAGVDKAVGEMRQQKSTEMTSPAGNGPPGVLSRLT